MSAQIPSEHVCYVHCNLCSTVLAVSVPRNCLFNMVTVRCGHCTNLLSVNMAPLLPSLNIQDQQTDAGYDLKAIVYLREKHTSEADNLFEVQNKEFNVTSPRDIDCSAADHVVPVVLPMPVELQETAPIRPPEKRQRVPSAYNKFIKEEIQRIKASNPEISHREAFSAAAKNWAHLPRIHMEMTFDGSSSPLLQDAQGFH